MKLDEILDQALTLVFDSQLSAEEATEKVLADRPDLDPEAIDRLLYVGVNRLLHERIVGIRRTSPTDRRSETGTTSGGARSGRFQLRTRPTEGAKAIYHLWKTYEAADGSQKPLYDFTPEDWTHARDRTAARLDGLRRHLDLFDLGAHLVDGSRAQTAADLSVRSRNRLEAAAADAFSSAVTE